MLLHHHANGLFCYSKLTSQTAYSIHTELFIIITVWVCVDNVSRKPVTRLDVFDASIQWSVFELCMWLTLMQEVYAEDVTHKKCPWHSQNFVSP